MAASSNNSKSENKKIKTPKPESKTKKERDSEKENKKKKKKAKENKKLKLSNGDSKQQRRGEEKKESKGTSQKQKRVVEEEEEDEGEKAHVFPMNRIRTMIKGEDPEARVSQEAILAINKAVEKFLEQLTQDAYARVVQERKKALSYNHLAHVVSKQKRYDFLSDFVPEKVKAEDALRERNSGGTGGG